MVCAVSMFKKILLVLALLLVVLVVVIAMRPSEFRISRKGSVAAPPSAVFAQVNEFRKWNEWSPWAKLDPEAKYTFEGPSGGVGAKFSWTGNNKVGVGSNEIVESVPNERVRIKLVFEKPMKATSEALFELEPEGAGTGVTWTMTGKNDFLGKAFGLFVDVDAMVGGDFERGLANLKEAVEASPNPADEPAADSPPE